MVSELYDLGADSPTVLLEVLPRPDADRRSDADYFGSQLLRAAASRMERGAGNAVVRFWFGPWTSEIDLCRRLAGSLRRALEKCGCTVQAADGWYKDGRNWEQGGVVSFDYPKGAKKTLSDSIPPEPQFSTKSARIVERHEGEHCFRFCTSLNPRTWQGRRGRVETVREPSDETVVIQLSSELARGLREAAANKPCRGAPADAPYGGIPWLVKTLGPDHPVSQCLSRISATLAGMQEAPDPLAGMYDDY